MEANLFSDEELENILFPSKKRIIYRMKKRVKEIIQDHPLYTIGMALALGLLLGVAFSNDKGN